MALPFLTISPRASRSLQWVLLVAMAFTSCEKLENGVVNEIEFPEHDPRLAVTMFVSPGDTVLYASIYKSASITDTAGSVPLTQATLKLTQGNTLLAEGDSSNWSEFPSGPWSSSALMEMFLDEPLDLQTGVVVLEVDASPLFEPLVVSEEVPEAPLVEHVFELFGDSSGYNHLLTLNLDNRPGVRDDYMIHVELELKKWGPDGEELTYWWDVGSEAVSDPRLGYSSGCACLLATDNGEDNVSMENILLEVEDYYDYDDYGEPIEPNYRLRVGRPAAALANHFNSIDAYFDALDNPFSEPTSVQGNIPDGFGIFGVSNGVVIPLTE